VVHFTYVFFKKVLKVPGIVVVQVYAKVYAVQFFSPYVVATIYDRVYFCGTFN